MLDHPGTCLITDEFGVLVLTNPGILVKSIVVGIGPT